MFIPFNILVGWVSTLYMGLAFVLGVPLTISPGKLFDGTFFWPIFKAQAAHYITLNGTLPSRSTHPVTLRWLVGYLANNPLCRETGLNNSWTIGITGPMLRNMVFPIHADQHGRFAVRIPLDNVRPGYCDWHPYYLAYSIKAHPKHMLDYFIIGELSRKTLPGKHALGKTTYLCPYKKLCHFYHTNITAPRINQQGNAFIYLTNLTFSFYFKESTS